MHDDPSPTPPVTMAEQAYVRLIRLTQPVSGLTDDERGARGEAIAHAMSVLARAPGETVTDIERKIAVLGTLLRNGDLSPTSTYGMLAILLADSARDDLTRLALPVPAEGADDV